jgi:hypothetical protein
VRWFVTFWWNFLDFNGYDEFQDFLDYGWRIPFSEFVVVVGFYIRLKKKLPLSKIQERTGRSENPVFTLQNFKNQLIFWHICSHYHFFVFYLMVFTLSWATSVGLFQRDFLLMQLFSVLFSFFIPVSALIADRIRRRKKCLLCHNGHPFFGFAFSFFLNSGSQFW